MVDWMKFLCEKLSFSRKTLHCSISYMDSIFLLCQIREEEQKLVCFVCLQLAAKIEEKNYKVPYTEVILDYFGNYFSREQFENCEINVFRVLNYNLSFKTPLHHLQILLEQRVVSEDELEGLSAQQRSSVLQLSADMTLLLIDLSLSIYPLYEFTSLAVASSVVAVFRSLIGLESWPSRMAANTGITLMELERCNSLIRARLVECPQIQKLLTGVQAIC